MPETSQGFSTVSLNHGGYEPAESRDRGLRVAPAFVGALHAREPRPAGADQD